MTYEVDKRSGEGMFLYNCCIIYDMCNRALRMDIHSVDHYITIAHLISCFAKSGLRLSLPQRRLIVQHYAIPSDEAEPLLPVSV